MAKKEHDEFASNIDLIDMLPPGLYEAVMIPKDPAQRAADLIGGDYIVRFEPRTLDDIRALGGNDEKDDRKFETVARVSDINLGLYRMFVQPWVRLWMNEDFADHSAPTASATTAVRDVLVRQSVHAPTAVGHWASA